MRGSNIFESAKREVTDLLTQTFEEAFDPEVNLVRVHSRHIYARGRKNVHDVAQASLYYAICLLESGEVEKAEDIIRKVLTAQELHEGNIHFGNFRWIYEDKVVIDLNAVQFVLQSLLTIYKCYSDKLSNEIKEEMRRSIGFGLRELENLDVDLSYTNIALLEIMNLIVGGELLNEPHFAERGYKKLDSWIDYTNKFGIREYNSPTYTGVDLAALASISMFSENRDARLKAKLAEERLWLHVATHYHEPSHQIAGPHSRAYPRDVMGDPAGCLKSILYAQLGEKRLESTWRPWIFAGVIKYNCPEYLRRLLLRKPLPYFVAETWNAEAGGDMYTYMTSKYALGTSSIGYGVQTNNLILHYKREKEPGYNVLFCRYIINDKNWRENPYVEGGMFFGAQYKNKAIALYGLPLKGGIWFSLKTDVILMHYKDLDQVLINDRVVEKVPVSLKPLDNLLVRDGDVYIAVRPLRQSNLGFEAPIVLNEDQYGDLVLSIYNYKGDAKSFWEYSSPKSPFYKGNIKAGFILEVGDADEYGSFESFCDHISKAYVKDFVDENKVREVTYKSGSDTLTIKVDLLNNVLLDRRINGQVYKAPMLEGTNVKQSTSGYIEVNGAMLYAAQAPAWLLSDIENGTFVAVNPSGERVPIRLITPYGIVETDSFSYGKIVYCIREETSLEIETIRLHAPVYLTKPSGSYRIKLNGRDVTDEAEETTWKGRRMLKISPA